ncbi:hypothetical protein FHS27_003545 [Rhodopirellula rubra]|uniref:Uncharacterized protein n=1 Tax=Aporhodopirellula rubra TaxID=980271 RepID=A0A7W5E107_9BACT|nr:hypothetical protein [Aporhodopirellula rubra]MBB3207718.1 hypothetical protein [Aporhodopirellula rubra]
MESFTQVIGFDRDWPRGSAVEMTDSLQRRTVFPGGSATGISSPKKTLAASARALGLLASGAAAFEVP